MARSLDVVRGTLELLIMKTLSAGAPLHGFGVLRWIREATADELLIEEGALYPAVHRMEHREWITGGVADLGEGSAGEVLPPDGGRAAAAGSAGGGMAAVSACMGQHSCGGGRPVSGPRRPRLADAS